jgi:tetratricopeptide (TPR) repeat protein
LGDILGKSTIPNLGDVKGSVAAYFKARAILESLCRSHPESLKMHLRLGDLLLAISASQASARDLADAHATTRQALDFWKSLAQRFPGDAKAQEGMAAVYFRLAIESESDEGRIVNYLPALEIYSRQLGANGQDWKAARNVALVHKYLGGAYENTDPERSLSHIRAASELDAKRVAALPSSHQAKLDYSFDTSMLGTYFLKRKDFVKAEEQFRKTVAVRLELWQFEPKDVFARERLSVAQLYWGYCLVQTGRRQMGLQQLRESRDHAESTFATTRRENSRITAKQARGYLLEFQKP